MESKRIAAVSVGAAALVTLTVSAELLKKPPEIDHGDVSPTALRGRVLTDSNAMAIPTEIAIVGSYVVAGDIASDSVVHVFDRGSGRLVRSLGRRGSGPGEFESAWTITPAIDNESAFWVYDAGLKRATFIDLTETRDPRSAAAARYVSFVEEATLTGPILSARGQWLSLGFFPDGRVGVFDGQGERVDVIGDVPPGPENITHPVTRQQVRLSTFVGHPGRRHFAAMPRYASNFELITLDSLPILVDGPIEVRPETFRNGPVHTGPTRTLDTRFSYVDGAASRDRIFGLFSGRTRREFEMNAVFGRFVHVFDWSGTFVAAYILEDDALAIAVDESGATLYAVRHEPSPAIVEYDLTSSPAYSGAVN